VVLDFDTSLHTAYPHRGVAGSNGFITVWLSLLFIFLNQFFLIVSCYFFAKLFVSHDDRTDYGCASMQHPAFHHHHNSMHGK
jgi:hypothetical protein